MLHLLLLCARFLLEDDGVEEREVAIDILGRKGRELLHEPGERVGRPGVALVEEGHLLVQRRRARGEQAAAAGGCGRRGGGGDRTRKRERRRGKSSSSSRGSNSAIFAIHTIMSINRRRGRRKLLLAGSRSCDGSERSCYSSSSAGWG